MASFLERLYKGVDVWGGLARGRAIVVDDLDSRVNFYLAGFEANLQEYAFSIG
jgi:hypothetical protein